MQPDETGSDGGGCYDHEAYQFVGENSKAHFEMRTHRSLHDQVMLVVLSLSLVVVVGSMLALIASGTVVGSALLRLRREALVDAAMWGGDPGAEQPTASGMLYAYAAFVSFGLVLLLIAAVLTAWAPAAAGSGLPPLKAFLNGCHMPQILNVRTLLSKIVGSALVVTTGLPIGREGPMVHIGAALTACVSSVRCTRNILLIFEMRSPAAQRNWVGMGAAAGVAAAFNAPLGGILYSLEEVCSHWSSRMTWLSFLCSVTVVAAVDVLNDGTDGLIAAEALVLGDSSDGASLRASFSRGHFLWIACLGAMGGVVGACYNVMAFRLARLRQQWTPSALRVARFARVAEVSLVGLVVLSIFFWAPHAAPCRPCPPHDAFGCSSPHHAATTAAARAHGSSLGGAAPSSGSGSHGSDSFHARMHSLRFRRYDCPAGQYNELATLLHAGQEELVTHRALHTPPRPELSPAVRSAPLRARRTVCACACRQVKHLLAHEDAAPPPALSTLALFLALYFATAVIALGIAVPAGNFIPAMTIGAALGRIGSTLLVRAGHLEANDVSSYALIGAAATLGGVTRMTMTVAVILAEISDDAALMPTCMLALAIARAVGDVLSSSFDHGMIALAHVPYLHEVPPRVFEVLTAKDVMAINPVTLLEVTTLRSVVNALKQSGHNGFPILGGSCLADEPDATLARPCLCGIILRRQLIVLLKERVWEMQMHGVQLSSSVREHFLTSFFVMAQVKLDAETARVCSQLSESDLDCPMDLRSFYDPAPFAVRVRVKHSGPLLVHPVLCAPPTAAPCRPCC